MPIAKPWNEFYTERKLLQENLRHFVIGFFYFLLNLMYHYAKNAHYTGIMLDALTHVQNHAGIML